MLTSLKKLDIKDSRQNYRQKQQQLNQYVQVKREEDIYYSRLLERDGQKVSEINYLLTKRLMIYFLALLRTQL